MSEVEVKNTDDKVKMDVSINAKGLAQWDVSVVFPTVVDSEKALKDAIKSVRKIIADNLLQEAGN